MPVWELTLCKCILSCLRAKMVKDEFKYFFKVENNFAQLKSTLNRANKKLEEFDFSEDVHDGEEVQKLRRLCLEVEELIHDTECLSNRNDPQSQHRSNVRNALHPLRHPRSCICNINYPRKIATKLQSLNDGIKRVDSLPLDRNNDHGSIQRQLIEFDFDQVEESKCIITELTTTSQESKGVSIIGLRGMGKTSLARHILNIKAVKDRFPLILKASFSGKRFDPGVLPTLDTMYRLVDENGDKPILESITHDFLKSTDSWLLWMDDLTDISIAHWNDIYKDMKGKFLFTTVNPGVATTTKTSPHCMGTLSEICCQHLIENLRCHVNRHQEFTDNCYGLLSVADFLKNFIHDERIFGKKLWEIGDFKRDCLPYLASSFQSLKGATARCLYYLSLFPVQHKFEEEELIFLGICAGLYDPTNNNNNNNVSISLEERREHFNKLLANSILQPASDEDLKYEMHKFAHGFAQFSAPKIYLTLSTEECQKINNRNLCHLSVTQKVHTRHQDAIKLRKCLRTFISIDDDDDNNEHGKLKEIQHDLFSKMKHLRVLVLKNTDIEELPDIAHLKRLRFLDISETRVGSLPKEVYALPYLQILKFKKRTPREVVKLHDDFSSMTALVYVDWDVNYIRNLQAKPANIGSLINLETLPLFVVTNMEGHCITELEKMNRLRNSLCITNLEAVQSEEDARRACIGDKSGLRSLKLVWITFPDNEKAKQVLTALKPHNSLKELHVVNYRWNSYPAWFGETSLELEKIHLENCSSCNLLESFGQLSALKALHIEGIHDLNSMDNLFDRIPGGTSQYFTSLETLVLNNLEDLEHWQKLGKNDMPLLEKLEIKGCNNLKTLPPLENHTSLKHIEIDGGKTLSSLPELPSSLESLIIKNSDSLASRCKPPHGEDWLKLANLLKKLEIDDQQIELPKTTEEKTVVNPRTGLKDPNFTDAVSKENRVERPKGIVIHESNDQRSENVNNRSGDGGGGKGKDKEIYHDLQVYSYDGTSQLGTSNAQIEGANPSKQMKNMENSLTGDAMPPPNGHTDESSANSNGQIDGTSQPEPCGGLGDLIPKGNEVKQTA